MLFMMPGERITRIHGPLVTDEEVEQVANYLRAQGEPDYVDSVTDESALEAEGGGALGLRAHRSPPPGLALTAGISPVLWPRGASSAATVRRASVIAAMTVST